MLFIDDKLPHIQQAKNLHAQYITCYINRKVYGKTTTSVCSDATCKICSSRTQRLKISRRLFSVLNQIGLAKLAGAVPSELLNIHIKFERLYKASGKTTLSNKDKISLNGIFNYQWFDDKENKLYNAYDLCNNLKIETCIYCNRLYTSTVISDKKKLVIRPTLDHWFPQGQYPILALSFYNLIPSCSPCNTSVKHASNFKLTKNIHPYVDSKVTSNYTLQSIYDKSLRTFKIKVVSKDNKIRTTLEEMKISAIYEHHQSELYDLDLLQKKYNKSYLKDLNKLLGTSLCEKEVYRIMFGVEYEDENFYKRPLSKLKKDILNIKLN